MKRESYISSSQHMLQTEKMFHYTCEECGKGTVVPREFKEFKTKIKGYPFVVDRAIIGVCENCGTRHFSARETKRWEELFNKKLEENHIIFTPDQIEQLRKSLRLSVEDFALLIGCTRQSIYNWERKSRIKPQSRMADLLMKLVDQSLKIGEVNVIHFLVDKAKELGIAIDIDVGKQISKHVSRDFVIMLTPKKVGADYLAHYLEESGERDLLAYAAETEEGKIIVAESANKDFVTILGFDYMTATVFLAIIRDKLELTKASATLIFEDGNEIETGLIQVKDNKMILVAETDDITEEITQIKLEKKES